MTGDENNPPLPPGWVSRPLGELADFTIGRTPPRAVAQYWARNRRGAAWVSIADLIPFGEVKTTAEEVTSEATRKIFGGRLTPRGTLLMSFKLTIGRTAVLDVDAHHNEAIISIYPKVGIERDYLRFVLPRLNFARMQDRAIKGNTLNKGKLLRLSVPVPPLDEQRAIAELLLHAQRAVSLETARVSELRALGAATASTFFRERLSEVGPENAAKMVLPDGWSAAALGSVARISTGTTPATDNPAYYCGEIPFVKTAEIANAPILRAVQHVSAEAVARYNLRIYPPGTVLLAMYGQGKTRGQAGLLQIPATTTQNSAAIEPGPLLRSKYLWFYLLSQYTNLRNTGNLGHLSHLNLGYVSQLIIPVAPLAEQEAIETRLSTIYDRMSLAESRVEVISQLFDALLNQVTTGALPISALIGRNAAYA